MAVESKKLANNDATTVGVARGSAVGQQGARPRKLGVLFSKALATLPRRVVVPAARLAAVARSAFIRLVCEWTACLLVRTIPCHPPKVGLNVLLTRLFQNRPMLISIFGGYFSSIRRGGFVSLSYWLGCSRGKAQTPPRASPCEV